MSIETAFKSLKMAVNSEIEKLEAAASAQIEPKLDLRTYIRPSEFEFSFKRNRFGEHDLKVQVYYECLSRRYLTKDDVDRVVSKYKSGIEDWVNANREIYQENNRVIEHNKKQVERLKVIMDRLGVPEEVTTFDYKTNRSRRMTKQVEVYSWPNEVLRHVKVSDEDYANMLSFMEKKKEAIKVYGENILKKQEEDKQKKAQEDEALDKVKNLAALSYSIAGNAKLSAEDLLHELLSKCKYLNLAHAMIETRNNLADDFYRVEEAMYVFTIDNPHDQKIHDEISEILQSGESDGRIFRDCDCNYDVIFSLVDDDLRKAYGEIVDLMD